MKPEDADYAPHIEEPDEDEIGRSIPAVGAMAQMRAHERRNNTPLGERVDEQGNGSADEGRSL